MLIKHLANKMFYAKNNQNHRNLSLESKLNHHISNAMTTLEFQVFKERCILRCVAKRRLPLSEDAYNTRQLQPVNRFFQLIIISQSTLH
jgi:hypothetical protein